VDQRPRAVTAEQRREEAIVAHIEAERERLAGNIQELRAQLGEGIHSAGERVGRATDRARALADRAKGYADWRTWLRDRPLLMVGIAFALGFWIAGAGRRRD
jgi:ElaB/YqjD/DUF883 family membrane-anchored ribosome-binding protein